MTRTVLAVCLALSLPAAAAAVPRERHEARRDRGELRDDLIDARLAEDLLRDFDRAAAMRSRRALRSIEQTVMEALKQETNEACREMGEAADQVRRSEQEVGREQREVARDVHRGDRREFSEDRRDLESDRREAADVRRDYMAKADYRNRIVALRDEWARLMGLHRPEWMQRKHDMLAELVVLSRREIRSDVDQIREDRDERRDDDSGWHDDHRDDEHGWHGDRP